MLDLQSIRAKNASLLSARGFRFVQGLPVRGADEVELRPRDEIVRRMAALNAVYLYVVGQKERYLARFPEPALRQMIRDHDLEAAMIPIELDILKLPRDEALAAHVNTCGWLTENMLPLAWALGYPREPGIDGAMLDHRYQDLCESFAPTTAAACASLLAAKDLRPVVEVVALEDLFYCCHNAVRQAQFYDPSCVPAEFDPVANGGVIHERRHALTWMLSPGVDWRDTDLST